MQVMQLIDVPIKHELCCRNHSVMWQIEPADVAP